MILTTVWKKEIPAPILHSLQQPGGEPLVIPKSVPEL